MTTATKEDKVNALSALLDSIEKEAPQASVTVKAVAGEPCPTCGHMISAPETAEA